MARRPIYRNVRRLIAQARSVYEAVTTKESTDDVRQVFGNDRENALHAAIQNLDQEANATDTLTRIYDATLANRHRAERDTVRLLVTLRTLIKTLYPLNPAKPAEYGFDVLGVIPTPGDDENTDDDNTNEEPTISTQPIITLDPETAEAGTNTEITYTITADPADPRENKWPTGTHANIVITNGETTVATINIEDPTSPIVDTFTAEELATPAATVNVTIEEPGKTPASAFANLELTEPEEHEPTEHVHVDLFNNAYTGTNYFNPSSHNIDSGHEPAVLNDSTGDYLRFKIAGYYDPKIMEITLDQPMGSNGTVTGKWNMTGGGFSIKLEYLHPTTNTWVTLDDQWYQAEYTSDEYFVIPNNGTLPAGTEKIRWRCDAEEPYADNYVKLYELRVVSTI